MSQFLTTTNLILELLLAALAVLGFVIFKNSKKRVSDLVFIGIILAAFIWVLTNLVTNLAIPYGSDVVLTWTRLTLIGPAIVPILLFLFADTFPNSPLRLSKPFLIILSIITLGLLVIVPTRFNVELVTINGSFSTFTPGPLYTYFSLYLLLSIIITSFKLGNKYKHAKDIEKTQIKITLVGIAASILLGLLLNAVLPLLGFAEYATIGSASISIFIIATGFAILKYKLLDIRLIVAEVVSYSAIIILATELFLSKSPTELVFRLVLVLAAGYGARLLIKSMELEIGRRKEVELLAQEKIETLKELEQRNKNLAALQRISDIVLNELDMKKMSQQILDEIPKQLENCIGAFVSVVRGDQLVAYSISTNSFTRKIYSLVGEDLEKYSHPINKEFNDLHKVLFDKKTVDGSELEEFISPPIPVPVAKTLQKLIGAKYIVGLPLYAGGEPMGVMMFVYKVEKEKLHEKDLEIAKAIADDMSLAIQRAQAFQKLKDANEYLSQLDKMKDEFISMASHELNTPLAAIEGYLSMILDEGMGKIDAQSREYLSRAYSSSKRLAELILDLLNVSRIEQGRLKMKYSKANLAEMAQSVIHELQIKSDSKKIYLKLEAAKDLPEIWCDPDRIREVIVNLTGNALKFTEKGGVTIQISKSEGEFIRVSVKDTGRGIAKEDQKKLFQKFSQVKREVDEHQGTGLGLYISKNFVELHKGKLWVESDAGKGAIFSFELPVLKKPPVDVEGAILEKAMSDPKIEVGKKPVPAIIAESSKK